MGTCQISQFQCTATCNHVVIFHFWFHNKWLFKPNIKMTLTKWKMPHVSSHRDLSSLRNTQILFNMTKKNRNIMLIPKTYISMFSLGSYVITWHLMTSFASECHPMRSHVRNNIDIYVFGISTKSLSAKPILKEIWDLYWNFFFFLQRPSF